MRILAIETSVRSSSVAALDGERLLDQAEFGVQQRSAQSFAPAILQVLKSVGWLPTDLQLIVVSEGPGSFTGLRVGVTAAKTLAYATGAEVQGVNTLEIIAAQVPGELPDVTAVMDAQRKQLFSARFQRDGSLLETIEATQIVDNEAWIQSLQPGQVVTGPGLTKLRSKVPNEVHVVDSEYWTPEAATLGRIGYLAHSGGCRSDLWKLGPKYYRQSAAEEKHAERSQTP